MEKTKIVFIFGTRPEAIKMAPVVLEAQKHPDYIQPIVVVTAQHREMLDQVLQLFQIKPDFDLNIMSARQTLYDISCRILTGLGELFNQAKPDLVMVHGDTTTTFISSLAAFYQQIPIGHVEAGLRTGNKYSPFPEEANRHLTGVLADLHFAPTATAKENLLCENVSPQNIFVTGNTVIDALQATVKPTYRFEQPALNECVQRGGKILLVTTHRRENLGDTLHGIYKALYRLVKEHPEVEIVFPVHKNPAVREAVQEELGGVGRIHLIDPLDYDSFANLMAKSYLVMTDSGGIQEEAPALGKPVLVLRDTTERPEAVKAGTVQLAGTNGQEIFAAAHRLLQDANAYKAMAEAVNPYGDGLASARIIHTILHQKGFVAQAPAYFTP